MDDLAARVDTLLRTRRSVRAFRPDAVAREDVQAILKAAACAPSNSNTQPWRVYALAGQALHALGEVLQVACSDGQGAPPAHFPDPLPVEFGARQADFAARYYASLGIDREDMEGRARQSRRNYRFFGAPVGLIFTIDARLQRHSWLDLGLFVQNVMIAAKARGIDTCPQVSFAPYHAVLARHLRLDAHELTACGMAMGYGDAEAPVNCMPMPRRALTDFARLEGFGPSQSPATGAPAAL